jgi:hypothetical protein
MHPTSYASAGVLADVTITGAKALRRHFAARNRHCGGSMYRLYADRPERATSAGAASLARPEGCHATAGHWIARRAALPLCLFTFALAACTTERLAPAAPRARDGVSNAPVLPELPLSVVDAPISYALEPALTALERAVPRHFGDIDKRLTVATNERQQIAFEADRTPFDVAFNGRRLTISTTVSYKGKGWYNPKIGPTIGASCGTDSLPPRLRVTIHSDVDVTTDWQLRTRTRLASVAPATDTPRDACRVTAFKIDVTDRVVRSITPLLAGRLPAVDGKIGAFDLHTRLERWYNLLNRNIRVKDSLWLVLAPRDVRLGELRLEDTALVANVRLFARPTLMSGPKPAEVSTSLPPFNRAKGEVGDSAHLRLEGLLTYADANAVLNRKLAGRKFRRFNQRVTVERVRLYPLGDGRVALALTLTGGVAGDAYFVGTPKLDTATRVLTVPDLDFDVSTADDLVRGLAWLKKGDIVTELRKRAQLPLDDLLEDTRAKVEKAMNRRLTEGVELTGSVRTGRLIDVVALPQWLVVRAEATGSLALHVDRAIPVPRKRRAD